MGTVVGTIRSTGKPSKRTGLQPWEIWVPKATAVGLPFLLGRPSAISLDIIGARYSGTLRSTPSNKYVWISPTIRLVNGNRSTLSSALKDNFVVNETVQLEVRDKTITISKLDDDVDPSLCVEWLKEAPEPCIRDLLTARRDLESVDPTTRLALVNARLGQGVFREALIQYWHGCALTGCSVLSALTASHVKPWRDSSNHERLDPFNGILLLGTFDLLFDAGQITFDDSGVLVVSNSVLPDQRRILALHSKQRLRLIETQHLAYLEWHRRHVFCP